MHGIYTKIIRTKIYNYYFIFGIADLTRIARKKCPPHLVSLIKVEGLFSSYIVTHFDIVNSESFSVTYNWFIHWTK
jgi:hypothetical protein